MSQQRQEVNREDLLFLLVAPFRLAISFHKKTKNFPQITFLFPPFLPKERARKFECLFFLKVFLHETLHTFFTQICHLSLSKFLH